MEVRISDCLRYPFGHSLHFAAQEPLVALEGEFVANNQVRPRPIKWAFLRDPHEPRQFKLQQEWVQ